MSADPGPATRPSPQAARLPRPEHGQRVPAGFGSENLARLRQAAHCLPQVVTPADYALPSGAAGEDQLDRLGLVQLHKPMAGARPGRWIEPALLDSALSHLNAAGSGPTARPVMLERGARLQALGLERSAGTWTRLAREPVRLGEPGWAVSVQFRAPIDQAAVWAYFRDGDESALLAALGPMPALPDAAAVKTHLDRLLARSRLLGLRHLPLLLPRLQAECAVAQALPDLLDACSRAQARWERRATELDAIEGLHRELSFHGYPDSFEPARRQQRRVTLYVGPPNAGKTHAAFERLAQAIDGAYLAPLRLLALEGRDRLLARGVPCSLLTGEENVPAIGARVVSSTIEMVDTRTPIDVAVVDEAQMLFDSSRGWAWTQAIVAVPATELIIICSDHAVAAIEKLLALCGEQCTVRRFERMQHVALLGRPVATAQLRLGDAVVAFSRREVLRLRDQISADGQAVSVVYGALPPEVRCREAERFAAGDSRILVATDAIGMGLNLPIRRVLFSTLVKFDGQVDRTLSPPEVHQIAGRAGRYGIHEEGFVGVLDEAEPTALRTLKQLLATPPLAPLDFRAPVAPDARHVDTIAARLQLQGLRQVLDVFVDQLRLDDAHFAVAALEPMLELAAQLDTHAARLSLKQRFLYAQAPVDTRSPAQVQEFLDWADGHAARGRADRPWFLDAVDGHSRLDRMEEALRATTLWLWLDLRFPGAYGLVDEVNDLRRQLNDGIERQLAGKRPLARLRQRRRQ